MAILVIAEHDNQALKAATLNPSLLPASWVAMFTYWSPVRAVPQWRTLPRRSVA